VNATTTYTEDGLLVHPDCLRALRLFLSEDPNRPGLHGVFLDEDGHLAATDGHTLMRLSSIDPGGQVPSRRAGTRWSRACVNGLLKAVPKLSGRGETRARQYAQQRACLRWDGCEDDAVKAPPIVNLMARAADCRKSKDGPMIGHRGEPSSMQWRYLRRLADACALMFDGELVGHKGPVLVNGPHALDPHVYEIPWHEPTPSDVKIAWMHGRAPAPTLVVPEPRCAAEVLIMPLRV
jgi:hypothetical protein